MEAFPTCGSVAMTSDRKCLVWSIGMMRFTAFIFIVIYTGTKFTSKNREISLQVKSLKFINSQRPEVSGSPAEAVSSPDGIEHIAHHRLNVPR